MTALTRSVTRPAEHLDRDRASDHSGGDGFESRSARRGLEPIKQLRPPHIRRHLLELVPTARAQH